MIIVSDRLQYTPFLWERVKLPARRVLKIQTPYIPNSISEAHHRVVIYSQNEARKRNRKRSWKLTRYLVLVSEAKNPERQKKEAFMKRVKGKKHRRDAVRLRKTIGLE